MAFERKNQEKKPTETVGQNERINNHVTLGHFAHFQSRIETTWRDKMGHANVVDIAAATIQIEPSHFDERHGQNGYGQNGTTGR